ncbi:ArgE/DapE family deacylase [Dictyobacter aurantiacus]|uniref:Acetylornithine deacetylase n=1 Tax=Dictyobacter aurantiacus TaxID=1936993 RepID=A0A401ZSA3_9CHLR|nr:ArgE/DapE family deacylase [Dictyobacter aurantiacus]GCE09660.1 acetylornithine deacetylase [Dictyobacter aurantiacus]
MALTAIEQKVLDSLDEDGLLASVRELLRLPSRTGQEAEAQHWLARRMRDFGLSVDEWTIDVAELRRQASFPGMEVDRSEREAVGLVGTWQGGSEAGRRLIFNGHIDVVPEGDRTQWTHDPWGGEQEGDLIYGRGACDMKGGLIAALYAIKAIKDSGVALPGSLMLQSVIGEEDGGLGTFASLMRGHSGDAAIVCEPTDLDVVPAQAGALTFLVHVSGKSAHACMRLEGVSAVEKYLDIHLALLQLERVRNSDVTHPLLGKFDLPYPLNIGRVQAGNWSSSVPDELLFEGRIGVAMGESCQAVREQFEQTLHTLAETDPWLRDHPLTVTWTGGQFESGEIPHDHPLVQSCAGCIQEVTGHAPTIKGITAGTDLRQLVNLGQIPALLLGPGDVRVAHMPDEHVRVSELLTAARTYILIALRFLQANP